jgi:hypothetical protein
MHSVEHSALAAGIYVHDRTYPRVWSDFTHQSGLVPVPALSKDKEYQAWVQEDQQRIFKAFKNVKEPQVWLQFPDDSPFVAFC